MDHMMKKWIEEHYDETIALLKNLAAIPAPSYHEEKRAASILNWLHQQGAEGAYIDDAGNVVYPYQVQDDQKVLVVMAHMDVVFPDMDAFTVREENGMLYAPGIGDDTANLVNLLMNVKYLLENRISCDGILFVANTCEEGLGNLKGSRQILEDWGDRIRAWISFDLYMDELDDRPVGSNRYRIGITTKGGHSFADFGEPNAIAVIAQIISELNHQKLPQEGITTFNFGEIKGGTSINVIAQEASVTYEFRAESSKNLNIMEENLQNILKKYMNDENMQVHLEVLGLRPGMGPVLQEQQDALRDRCLSIMQSESTQVSVKAASTDCNIPLSVGIPAVTCGTVRGGLLHTREEWIEAASMLAGQAIAIRIVLAV